MNTERQLILVADDDRSTRFLFRQMLEQDGHEVIEAANGEETISICEKRPPDLVLIDAMMPQMDGFTACASIKKAVGERHVPILMITSLDDDKVIDMAYNYGVVDFIIKPVNFSLLRHRVRQVLNNRRLEMMVEKNISGESITELIHDGIIIIDGDDAITSFNPSAGTIFGCQPQEMLGKKINKLIPGFVPSRFKSDGSNEIEINGDRIKVAREILWHRKSGETIPIEVMVDGATTGDKLVTVRDLTEKKQTESKAKLMETLYENISEAIMIIDGNNLIRSVNPAFTKITGYEEREVAGKNFQILQSELNSPGSLEDIVKFSLREGQWRGESFVRRKDGANLSVSCLFSAFADPLEPGKRRYVAIFHDISEQLRLRARAEALQKEAVKVQKMTLLSTISAGIIHEINQPLNSIKILADSMIYLDRKGRDFDKAKSLENFRKISDQIDRIEEIIKHMRAFAHMKHSHETSHCDINDAVEKAIVIFGRQLSSHNIRTVKKFGRGLPKVNGNINIFEEVVINLIVNAMQALDSTEKADKTIVCETAFEDGKVVLSVSDNAHGIRDDIRDRIFEPFFSTKSIDGGMGLGLALVQTILSTYNGIIGVANNGEGGATFRVELPVAQENSSNGA